MKKTEQQNKYERGHQTIKDAVSQLYKAGQRIAEGIALLGSSESDAYEAQQREMRELQLKLESKDKFWKQAELEAGRLRERVVQVSTLLQEQEQLNATIAELRAERIALQQQLETERAAKEKLKMRMKRLANAG